MAKKLCKTLMFVEETGQTRLFDTINYKNHWWIVPEWIENKHEKSMRPKRIILIDGLGGMTFESGQPFDFQLSNSIPKSVLDGDVQNTLSSKYTVEIDPDIKFPSHFE